MSVVSYFNALIFGFVTQIFAQMAVGYYSDITVTRWGRRKPFLAGAMLWRFIMFLFLTTPPSKDGHVLTGWYTTFLGLYALGVGSFNPSFDSWVVESTRDDADFSKIRSVANPIGGAIGASVGFFLLYVSPIGLSIGTAIIGSCVLYVVVKYIPNKVFRTAPKTPELIPSVRICMQTTEFVKLMINSTLFSAASIIFLNTLLLSFILLYDAEKVQDAVNYTVVMSGVGGSLGVVLVISCNWLFKRFEKLNILRIFFAIVGFLSICIFFASLSHGENEMYGEISYVIMGSVVLIIGFSVSLINNILLRDLVMFDKFLTGIFVFISNCPLTTI
jgi:Na+/melibiose symporter-like transporter